MTRSCRFFSLLKANVDSVNKSNEIKKKENWENLLFITEKAVEQIYFALSLMPTIALHFKISKWKNTVFSSFPLLYLISNQKTKFELQI